MVAIYTHNYGAGSEPLYTVQFSAATKSSKTKTVCVEKCPCFYMTYRFWHTLVTCPGISNSILSTHSVNNWPTFLQYMRGHSCLTRFLQVLLQETIDVQRNACPSVAVHRYMHTTQWSRS